MGCCYCYCPCQVARRYLAEKSIQRGTEDIEMVQMRKQYIEEKGYTIVEMWVPNGGNSTGLICQ